MPQPFDAALMRQVFQGPGIDTRNFVSFATVNQETEDTKSVTFDEELGPLVTVTLQPSGKIINCRVAQTHSGAGEGSYAPFIAKDEVIVIIPNGNENNYGVIVGRMPNAIDSFPTIVAGAESTLNNVTFHRYRSPQITETTSGWLLRNATTGSQFAVDEKGQIIASDGDKNHLMIGPDSVGFVTGDEGAFMQLDPAEKTVSIGADTSGTTFTVGKDSTFTTYGTVTFATGGFFADGHAITGEQVVALLASYTCALYAIGYFTPLVPPNPTTLTTMLSAAIVGLASPLPAGPAPGGNITALQGAIATALLVPPVPPIPGTLVPGFAKANFSM